MSRRAQLVLLCEDRQHEVFARRFLARAGWPTRRLRVEKAPPAEGSAEQFVRERFPVELSAYRANRGRVAQGLLVMVDGDDRGVTGRTAELEAACRAQGVPPRQDDDRVAIAVPTWNVETWLAYLAGSTVDESKSDYPRLARAGDCRPHVDELLELCRHGALRQPSPASLESACDEYRARLDSENS